jgi:hypothetical protein
MSDVVLSTIKGVGFPTKTTAEKLAIVEPITGAVVFDSDLGQLSLYNGDDWVPIGGGGGGFETNFLLMGC